MSSRATRRTMSIRSAGEHGRAEQDPRETAAFRRRHKKAQPVERMGANRCRRFRRRRIDGFERPRHHMQQVLRVTTDVEFGIGVNGGLAMQQQAGADVLDVLSDCAVGLAVQQLAGERDPLDPSPGRRQSMAIIGEDD